jgi:LuxR family maltose regulon positive regulatory protein
MARRAGSTVVDMAPVGDPTTADPAGPALTDAAAWGDAAGPHPVLRSKLHPARHPAHVLRRPRLHALLDECVTAPVTLVVAPAGSGKTSLLRSWSDETAVPYAWLSLEEEDRDPVRLWQGMLAALDSIAPGSAAAAGPVLHRPGGLLPAVNALLDDLDARESGPRVLVVDDLQFVDEQEGVASSLAIFVQHLPHWLHVVMASRHAPQLPVDRLRARGELVEVTFAELRFTLDEAVAMLTRLVPSLAPEDAAETAVRAGGWAASIQLAALSARSSNAQGTPFLPSSAGHRSSLEDYVRKEILLNESEELVDVLLATSVVTHVDARLAQVLSSRADAVAMLTVAEGRGLFVSRVEPAGFETHALFREALQSILAERSPERLARLQGVAAAWCEEHGQTTAALELWSRAGRPRDALRLLAARVQMLYDAGHETSILRALAELPASAVSDVDSMTEHAWCHLLVDRRRYVDLVDELGRLVDREVELDPTRAARVDVLRAIAASLRGDWAGCLPLAEAALARLGDTWWVDPIGQSVWNVIGRELALSERWETSGQEVEDLLAAVGVVPERRIAIEGTRALAEALAGRPVDALRLVAGARRTSEISNMTILRTELLAAEAIAHREVGDAALALPILRELADGRVEAGPHCQLLALLDLVELQVVVDDLQGAARDLGTAAELVDLEMPGGGARSRLARTATVLALASGDTEAARGWAAQVDDPFWSRVSSARVELAIGDNGSALDTLKAAEPRCLRHRVLAGVLRSRATPAPADAERLLLEAVEEAAAHGLVQTVASEGRDVIEAVERLAWRVPPAWLDRLRRAGPAEGSGLRSATAMTIETLTERELQVLRLLPSRLTLREVADELFISLNTLKFHLKVIYRKLGCTSRAEAADVARGLVGLHHARQPPRQPPRQSSRTRRR